MESWRIQTGLLLEFAAALYILKVLNSIYEYRKGEEITNQKRVK
jgi:hypothetical protein